MDKRLIMAVLAVLLAMVSATAVKWYHDPYTGYSGAVIVDYLGSSKEGASPNAVHDLVLNNWRNAGVRVGNRIDKLTKEQSWLLVEAIKREYDYSAGDIFRVVIGKTDFVNDNIVGVVVEITAIDSGGGFSYSWLAYPIDF